MNKAGRENLNVEQLTFQVLLQRGRPHGSQDEDWCRAERELRNAPDTKCPLCPRSVRAPDITEEAMRCEASRCLSVSKSERE